MFNVYVSLFPFFFLLLFLVYVLSLPTSAPIPPSSFLLPLLFLLPFPSLPQSGRQFSSVQFNDVFKKLKTRLGVDEEGVEGGVDGGSVEGSSGVGVTGNSGATTPNGIGANDSSSGVHDVLNGGGGGEGEEGGGGGGEGQPRLSAFEVGE